MYARWASIALAGVLLSTPAFALTDSNRPTQTQAECKQLVEVTKQSVEDQNDVGEKAQLEIDRMLAELDNQCQMQQFEQADQTAAHIRGLIATE